MRLTELKPKWVTLNGWASEYPFYVGVSFLCPTDRERRLAVHFWPPIDPKGLLGTMFTLPYNGGHRRTAGETFDTLTLTPSVGLDPFWHGHISDGAVT